VNRETKFINAVHKKINQKKEQRVNLLTFGASIFIVIMMMTFHQKEADYFTETLTGFSHMYNVEVYTWEYLEDLTEDEIFTYLLEGETLDDFIDFAEQDEQIKNLVNSINWETTQ